MKGAKMTVKLIPNEAMQNCLMELVQNRTILHIECEASQMDILKYNSKRAKNFGKRDKAIVCLNNNIQYKSIRAASIDLGLDPGAISRLVSGKRLSTNGYKFSLKEK